MKKQKYVLSNGVISYIITPEDNKVLINSDGIRLLSTQYLGMKYRDKDGSILENPVLETPEDYSEDDITEDELKQLNDEL